MNNYKLAEIITSKLNESELTIREIEAITGIARGTINNLKKNPENSKLSTLLKIFEILKLKIEITDE